MRDEGTNSGRGRARQARRRALAAFAVIGVIAPLACRPPVNTGNPEVVTRPWGAVEREVGCLADRSAASLSRFFGQRVGTVMGMDNGHMIPIGGDRFLWIFQDAFLDPLGNQQRISGGTYLHNVALLQKGNCFTLIHRGTAAAPLEFEPGDVEPDTRARFFWPLGGSAANGRVKIFWAEMQHDFGSPLVGNGIQRHPVRTWLADYDATSLQRLSIAPAPNPGVSPQWGFAVESDQTHSYLFGNSNMLNYSLVGGWANGPHTVTRMFVARVPRHQLTARPEYRAAAGWSTNAAAAVPISERFYFENQMQPRLIDGRWVSVTKVDGFAGSELVVDVAAQPWGPWTTVQRTTIDTQTTVGAMLTYHPMLMPWRDPSGDLIVMMSRNSADWALASNGDPALYRSIVMRVPFPPAGAAAPTAAAADGVTNASPPATTTTAASTEPVTAPPTSSSASTTAVTPPPTGAPIATVTATVTAPTTTG